MSIIFAANLFRFCDLRLPESSELNLWEHIKPLEEPMFRDSRLQKLREMDPVIGTYTARDLGNIPETVNQIYLEHAETHMSLGDTSKYLDSLIKWTTQNKGAVIGAISGEYGYGKTSIRYPPLANARTFSNYSCSTL